MFTERDYRLDWDEQTIKWNYQPSSTEDDQVRIPVTASTNSAFIIDVTNLVRIMNDGQSNYGFLWILNPEQKWRSVFAASSDYTDPAKRPKLVVTYAPMKKYFYLKDHLGNIRVTVDESGVVKGYNDYYPFGLRMPGRSMNTALNYALYKYSSKELDEENGINWYYFGARYYDPEIGRWLSVDPMADKYPFCSPYNYILNNPIRYIDPNGLWTKAYQISFLGTGAIAGGFSLSAVHDGESNYGFMVTVGLGGSFGTLGMAGLGVQYTNAKTIYDLAGPSFALGLGGGTGFSLTGEFNASLNFSYAGASYIIGSGVGVSSYLMLEYSFVAQTGDAKEVVKHLASGGKVAYKKGKILLLDKNGNIINEIDISGLEINSLGGITLGELINIFQSKNETQNDKEDKNSRTAKQDNTRVDFFSGWGAENQNPPR
ncbi:RHS repeat-associated core domain-containing protein [Calditrichota bacterium GD2]